MALQFNRHIMVSVLLQFTPVVCFHIHRLFVSLFDLYWTLFGIVEKDSVRLPPGFQLQETIGTLMFAAYHVVGVLVLLNALIGMLSNTYMKVGVSL